MLRLKSHFLALLDRERAKWVINRRKQDDEVRLLPIIYTILTYISVLKGENIRAKYKYKQHTVFTLKYRFKENEYISVYL